jgi:outer membrane protein OmpA-like peptidoglycan-associated protein
MTKRPYPRSRTTAVATLLVLLVSGSCATGPESGERHVSGVAAGANAGPAAGVAASTIVGDRHNRTEMITGAGISPLAATDVDGYMDREERDVRARTAGTGVDVQRRDVDLILAIPSAITFDPNSYAIKPGVHTTLDQLARTLAHYNQSYIDVYGHTDAAGDEAVNVPLSQNRAQAIANYLQVRGVAAARIGTKGFGGSMPVAANDTEAGRQANRRVEIKIVPLTEADVANPG